jgi:hypothetical protein
VYDVGVLGPNNSVQIKAKSEIAQRSNEFAHDYRRMPRPKIHDVLDAGARWCHHDDVDSSIDKGLDQASTKSPEADVSIADKHYFHRRILMSG